MIQEKDIRTFDDFAQWKSADPDDRFALRVLKNLVTDLINSPNLGNVHRALAHPRSSGSDDWDRIICGAALYVSHARIIIPPWWTQWAKEKQFPPRKGIFDPAHQPEWFATNWGNTPIEFAERAVCLSRDSLKGL